MTRRHDEMTRQYDEMTGRLNEITGRDDELTRRYDLWRDEMNILSTSWRHIRENPNFLHFFPFCALSILGQQLLFKREHRRVEPIHGHVYRKLRFLVEACGLSDGEKGSRLWYVFRSSTTIPEKKGVDVCKQMSSSRCSFTCICEIFLPFYRARN